MKNLAENLIFKFKDQIRYEIKKKLSKNDTELCNEDLFYNIFKDFIKWYLDERHYEGIVSYIINNKKILIEWVEKRIVENNNNITFGGFMIIKFKTDRG